MPLMAGSVMVIFDGCKQVDNLPMGGLMFGDTSTSERRLQGFGPVAQDLIVGATYCGDRTLEPRCIREHGSVENYQTRDGQFSNY